MISMSMTFSILAMPSLVAGDSCIQMLLNLPIFAQELVLALWRIIQGIHLTIVGQPVSFLLVSAVSKKDFQESRCVR
jgi:hypothetical protein